MHGQFAVPYLALTIDTHLTLSGLVATEIC